MEGIIVSIEADIDDSDHSQIDILIDWADSANPPIGYWAWAFIVASCTPALISDANGTPTQTYGQGFHDHLLACNRAG